MQVICPACKKTSISKTDISGRSVKCGCGQSFVVPSPEKAQADGAGTLALKCECGKTHRVPGSAAGKSFKCNCGRSMQVPGGKPAAAVVPAPQPQAPSAALFNAMTDDDWASLAPKPEPAPDPYAKPKPKSNSSNLLAQARKDMGETKKAVRSSAGSELAMSRWILIGVGTLRLALGIFWLVVVEATVAATLESSPELDGEFLLLILRVIFAIDIGFAVLFILMGVFIFLLPLTTTITAFVLFVLLEIVGLIFNPLSLISIRDWIIRGAIGGALLQAINNAAYYKYVKSGARDVKPE